MATSSRVGIFWDYENCPPPSNLTREEESCKLAHSIREIGRRSGIITEFKAYIDTSDQPLGKKAARLRSELSAPGVTFVDCRQGGKKNAVDIRIIVDMLCFAGDSQSPVTILLITGDGDYTYGVAMLIDRGHKVVVMGPFGASISLKRTASEFVDWDTYVLRSLRQSSPHNYVVNEEWSSPQVVSPGARPGDLVEIAGDRAEPPSPSDYSFVTADDTLPYTETRVQTTLGLPKSSVSVATGMVPRETLSSIGTELALETENVDTTPPGMSRIHRGSMDEELVIPGSLPASSPIHNSVAHSNAAPVGSTPRSLSHGSQEGLLGPSSTFGPLIQVIRCGYEGDSGNPKILRSRVGEDLRKGYPTLSKWSKKELRQYLRRAEQAGVIEVDSSKRWVELKLQSDGIS